MGNDDKPTLYEKDWTGQYRPARNWLGQERHAGEPLGPQVKRSVLTGEPVPAHGLLGTQKRAADGTPLYEATKSGLGGDLTDQAATAATMGVLAIVIAALVGAAVAAAWAVRRFVASARADYQRGTLSLSTLGFGLVLACAVSFLLGVVAGPVFYALGNLLLFAALFFVLGYAPARAGELARASAEAGRPVPTFWRWAVAAAASALFTLGLVNEAASSPASGAAGALLFLSLLLGEGAACVWAWQGRPDLVRQGIARYRANAAAAASAPASAKDRSGASARGEHRRDHGSHWWR